MQRRTSLPRKKRFNKEIMVKKIIVGIQRHPKRFLLTLGSASAILWTVLEPLFAILDIKTTGYESQSLIAYCFLALVIALFVNHPKKSVVFGLKNTNTKVEIVFGDLFNCSGHKVISVSEFHDTKIGKPVSPNSVQGIFINKIIGNHITIIDQEIKNQLSGQEIGKLDRVDGKKVKYKIGSTISIPHNNDLFFLFALSKTDINCNAYATPSIMLEALDGLWQKIRLDGNGADINLPLIGDGLSRVGLPKPQLIQLILIALLKAVKERDLSSTIRIVLLEKEFEKVDLSLIKNNWQ